MSSPKASSRKVTRRAGTVKGALRVAREAKAPPRGADGTSGATPDAARLAAEIERGLARGDLIAPEALQPLMAALCKSYAAHIEAGHDFLPVKSRTSVTSTDIMTTASGLLKSQSLAVFELGMWQTWTGR
jgi:hypothetical protein